MRSITVLDQGREYTFTFEDMLKYHGGALIGGVSHAFKVMERAFPLLDNGNKPERREIELTTAFPGQGGRDAFELVTRCVTEGKIHVDKDLEEAKGTPESPAGHYYFRFSYRGKNVVIKIKQGVVKDEFIQLSRKKERTEEEWARLEVLKNEMSEYLLSKPAEELYDAEIC